jgi:hypothetical protein
LQKKEEKRQRKVEEKNKRKASQCEAETLDVVHSRISKKFKTEQATG